MKGKDLIFISLIKRDGSGTIPVGTQWNEKSDHPKTDTVDYMDDDFFELHVLSLTHKTFIAHGFNSWVVKINHR